MTMNCDYDSVLGVILPVENFYTAVIFLLVVKMAAPHMYSPKELGVKQILNT